MSIIRILSRLANIVTYKKYRKNPVAEDLSYGKLSALCIGAINAQQVGYYYDSLTTGSDAAEIRKNIADFYNITDRATAFETLQWLNESGHRVYFDLIKGVVSGMGSGYDIEGLDEGQINEINEYIKKLNDSLDELGKHDFIGIDHKEDLNQKSVLAWDMGRLVLVTRCCYDSGYISEDEAWEFIDNAHRLCKDTYGSWEDLAGGYVIGRAMWSGRNTSLSGIISIAKGLLEDEESPWKQCML